MKIALRVTRQTDWDGHRYEAGDAVAVEAGHPRLEAMVTSRQFVYDAAVPSADQLEKQPKRRKGR